MVADACRLGQRLPDGINTHIIVSRMNMGGELVVTQRHMEAIIRLEHQIGHPLAPWEALGKPRDDLHQELVKHIHER